MSEDRNGRSGGRTTTAPPEGDNGANDGAAKATRVKSSQNGRDGQSRQAGENGQSRQNGQDSQSPQAGQNGQSRQNGHGGADSASREATGNGRHPAVITPERPAPGPDRDGGMRPAHPLDPQPQLQPEPVPQPEPTPAVPYLVSRLGLGDDVRELLYHPVPRRTHPLDYLGFITLFLFASQIITGILLATAYQPTVAGAYGSVRAIMASPAGSLVRGLHAWGADALIVVAAMHLLRVFYIGAYKPPREFTWVTGALLLAVTIGFAFSGYLLPWDQQAYWATMVGTAMASYAPAVGQGILELLRGGTNITGATLTRFYALHVLVLPALLLLIFSGHFALVLTHGLTDVETRLPKGYRAAHKKGATSDFPKGDYRPFWPYTLAQMTVGIVLAAAALLLLAATAHLKLLPAADPLNRAHYQPVPAWYFYGIYQLLKYMPGRLDAVAMIGLPLVAAVVLVGLPFFDRNPARAARRRPYAMGTGSLLLVAVVLLTYLGWRGSKLPAANAATIVAAPAYAANIQPIFSASCTGCHGAAAPSGGLNLTSYAGLMKGGRSGAVVQPGNPQSSLLIQVLEGGGKGIPAMPLGQQPLPATEIQTIKNWISAGAKG